MNRATQKRKFHLPGSPTPARPPERRTAARFLPRGVFCLKLETATSSEGVLMSRRVWAVFGAVLAAWLAGAFSRAAEIPPSEATVTDSEGKEVKVGGLKFTVGTRRL